MKRHATRIVFGLLGAIIVLYALGCAALVLKP